MNKQDREKLKDLAKLLFVHETLTQKEIAKRIGVSEVTISKWANSEKWEELKVSITITKEEQLRNLYRQLGAINHAIAGREIKYATPAEADTISKLAVAIQKMETDVGISDIVSVAKKFLSWLRRTDLQQAQALTPLFDTFIKDNLR